MSSLIKGSCIGLLLLIGMSFRASSFPCCDSNTESISILLDETEGRAFFAFIPTTYAVEFPENSFEKQSSTAPLIATFLKKEFKKDLENEFLDSLSRQFKFSEVDLNADGVNEILLGLTGPYFCGSGGCTVYLLSQKAEVITKFSVVDYPVFVADSFSKGWKDLIMNSGRKNRLVPFNGKSYPSNPSVLEVYAGSTENLVKLLDWENLPPYKF
ncbi:hypothetical protein JYB64_20490 [Algoriphagus aestuarii]|nr:hypothetical protein [Algoriphagus aestuarii]